VGFETTVLRESLLQPYLDDEHMAILDQWVHFIQGSRAFFRLFDNHTGELSTALIVDKGQPQ
jgi:hypothetical protein